MMIHYKKLHFLRHRRHLHWLLLSFFFILLHQQEVDAVVNLRMAKVSITWYKNPRPTGTRTQGGWQTMRALYHRATGPHTRWRIDFSLELLYIQPTAKEFVPICVNYTLGANCNLVANRVQAGTRTRGCLHTVPMLYRWATESHNRGQIDIL